MRTVVVHPFGNPNVYNVATAFHEIGQLSAFHTCLFGPLRSKLRYEAALKYATTCVHPTLELVRLLLTRVPGLKKVGRSQRFVDLVGLHCDLDSSRGIGRDTQAVYGYEDFALRSFERAEALGAQRIYELPIGHHASHKTFLEQEVQGEPEIRSFIQALNEPEDKIRRKEAEISLATHIICASSFTASTVPEYAAACTPVSVTPYGVNCSGAPKGWNKNFAKGPLKLIFVGRLDPRKGLHTLFRALNALPKHSYDLTLAGRWVPGFKKFLEKRFSVSYRELGQVPHNSLHEIYKQHDALVFPSLFEGFGLVILEAMAAGIPVIATERTAGPDIFTKESGIVVRAGKADDLTKCIDDLLANRNQLADRGIKSRKIAESLSWERYRAELIEKITVHAKTGSLRTA